VNVPTASTVRGGGEFQAKTFVDQVVEALLERALKGVILPGERLYELDLSRDLGISRAPIREALRILEAQGVVESAPYRGMRLAPLTADRIRHINLVRFELEKLALREALASEKQALLRELDTIVRAMRMAGDHGDRLEIARLDTEFHGVLCAHGRNPVIMTMWSMLRPQLLIVFGMSMFEKDPTGIADEHVQLLAVLRDKSAEKAIDALRDHIVRDNTEIDFASLVERRRAAVAHAAKLAGGEASPAPAQRKPRGRPRRVPRQAAGA
jgi:DNA-binding GntR family transcriptional regulator